MKTSKQHTFDALDTYFLNTGTNKVVFDNLCYNIELLLDNEKPLYDYMHNSRVKPTSVVWAGFIHLANECLKETFYREKFQCSSTQLNAYLAREGVGYEALTSVVEFVKTARAEHGA